MLQAGHLNHLPGTTYWLSCYIEICYSRRKGSSFEVKLTVGVEHAIGTLTTNAEIITFTVMSISHEHTNPLSTFHC